MSTIPTPPTWAVNDSSLSNVQAVSDCAKFLTVIGGVDANTNPAWHLYRTATQSVSGATLLTFNTVALDSDSLHDGTGVVIQTQGLYMCELALSLSGASGQVKAYLQITAGTHNPNHTAGATVVFALNATAAFSGETPLCVSDITPWACYLGDTIRGYVAANGTVSVTNMKPAFTGRFHGIAATP